MLRFRLVCLYIGVKGKGNTMKTSDKICIAFEAFMFAAAIAVMIIGIIGSVTMESPETETPKTEQSTHVTPHTYQQVHPVTF